ncbi:MAG: Slam-dependent surface lipoprotein [Lonepinella koalarum]|nr:Slam-dependent surface lipoprotein [Lonepinella koalarum]
MKLIKLSLATLLLSTLTACGSGGGGSADTSSNTNNAQPPRPTTLQSSEVKGHRYKGSSTVVREDTEVTTNKNILVINGQQITLIPTGFSSATYIASDASSKRLIDNSFNYLKHGFYEDLANSKSYFFVQGNETLVQNIPTSGQVNYSGKTVTGKHNSNAISSGTVNFTVDFQARTLSGTATGGELSTPVELRANITGNTFQGTHNNTLTEGRFYGQAAEEMGGTFFKNNEFLGSFGAKKQ